MEFGSGHHFFSSVVVALLLPLFDIWHSFLIVHAAFAIVVVLVTSAQTKHVQFIWIEYKRKHQQHLLPNRRASSDSAQHLLSGKTGGRCYIIMTFFGYFSVRVKCVSRFPFKRPISVEKSSFLRSMFDEVCTVCRWLLLFAIRLKTNW